MSKNNLRWITLVRGPIWGIHSLTLIISWYRFILTRSLSLNKGMFCTVSSTMVIIKTKFSTKIKWCQLCFPRVNNNRSIFCSRSWVGQSYWYKAISRRWLGVTAFSNGMSCRDILSPVSLRMYVKVPRVTLKLDDHSSSGRSGKDASTTSKDAKRWGCIQTSLKRGGVRQLKTVAAGHTLVALMHVRVVQGTTLFCPSFATSVFAFSKQ